MWAETILVRRHGLRYSDRKFAESTKVFGIFASDIRLSSSVIHSKARKRKHNNESENNLKKHTTSTENFPLRHLLPTGASAARCLEIRGLLSPFCRVSLGSIIQQVPADAGVSRPVESLSN